MLDDFENFSGLSARKKIPKTVVKTVHCLFANPKDVEDRIRSTLHRNVRYVLAAFTKCFQHVINVSDIKIRLGFHVRGEEEKDFGVDKIFRDSMPALLGHWTAQTSAGQGVQAQDLERVHVRIDDSRRRKEKGRENLDVKPSFRRGLSQIGLSTRSVK